MPEFLRKNPEVNLKNSYCSPMLDETTIVITKFIKDCLLGFSKSLENKYKFAQDCSRKLCKKILEAKSISNAHCTSLPKFPEKKSNCEFEKLILSDMQ